MSSLGLVLLGFGLLVLQTSLAVVVPLHEYAPNLLLPIAIYSGVSPDVPFVRGTALGFALGYLLDAFCGNPMGLHTFVMTASFMLARGAGLRLFPEGPAFQVLLTFLMAIAFGATVIALRAIFEQPSVEVGRMPARALALSLLKPALVTALLSPLVFAAVRRIQPLGQPRRESSR